MSKDRTHLTRQYDLIPLAAVDTPVTIIGAGAVGSWVTFMLARMGMENLTVYDADEVSIENMNNQCYPFRSIGQKKVVALSEWIEDFNKVKIRAVEEFYTGGHFPGIVVASVDSMKARQLIFDEHADRAFRTTLVVDPRMGGESAMLFTYNPMDLENCASYKTSLYSDEDAVQERCTEKATIYTAGSLASLVVKAVKDHIVHGRGLRHATWDIKGNQLICFNNPAQDEAVLTA